MAPQKTGAMFKRRILEGHPFAIDYYPKSK
jgi:hypothetical protein